MGRPALIAAILLFAFPVNAVAQTSEGVRSDEVLVRINGSDTIESEETVNVAVVVSGDLTISGRITGVATVVDGDLEVLDGSTVTGTLVVVDGTLTMRAGSMISGDVYLSRNAKWIVEEGAEFSGEARHGNLSPEFSSKVAWQIVLGTLVGWLATTFVGIVAATIFSGIGGRQLWTSAGNLSLRPGASVLAAFLFWLGLLLVMVPTALTLIAFPMLILFAIVGFSVWGLGYLTFSTRLGATIIGSSPDDSTISHPYLPSVAGVVTLQVVALVSLAGILFAGLAVWLGDTETSLGFIVGLPSAILVISLIATGLLGSGGLILKAVDAWMAQ